MRAELDGIYCAEAELDGFSPVDPDRCVVQVAFVVRPKTGEPPYEWFTDHYDVSVCTPFWLEEKVAVEGGVMACENYIIVNSPDLTKVVDYITARVEACEGDDWEEIAAQLNKFAFRTDVGP